MHAGTMMLSSTRPGAARPVHSAHSTPSAAARHGLVRTHAAPASRPAEAADMRDMRLPDTSAVPVYVFPLFRRLSELFGPKLPADITYESVALGNAALDPMQPFRCSYDEGFGGHFSCPGCSSAAIKFDAVMAQPDPFAWLKENMRFHPAAGGASAAAADELVVFSPGLNTLHMLQPGWEGESTTPQRLQRYVDILQRPMAQLHIGTDMDQGPAVLLRLSDRACAFIKAKRPLLKRFGFDPGFNGNLIELSQRNRDYLEAAMSAAGHARPLFQEHVLRLLEFNETAQQPLVLMPYSRTTAEVAGALRRYKERFLTRYMKQHGRMAWSRGQGKVEALLRRTLTVVTYGNIDMRWWDGPAYVHVSSLSDREGMRGTDVLTNSVGVNANRRMYAGKDAVFLNYDGVYSGGDPHNLGAVGVQAIRIAMKMNGVDTFRGLWEKGQEGPLEVPGLEQLRAATIVTDSEPWLFSPGTAKDGVEAMSREEAERLLQGIW
eukprot:jgi/Ulvmu1/2492/UM137_0018.1